MLFGGPISGLRSIARGRIKKFLLKLLMLAANIFLQEKRMDDSRFNYFNGGCSKIMAPIKGPELFDLNLMQTQGEDMGNLFL